MDCPYCGKASEFVTSKDFYGQDFGSNLYLCRPCNAYVGTHKNSHRPLGTMANHHLRQLRKRAHREFDPLWKSRRLSRSGAYLWLQQTMQLSPDDAHIGKFNEAQCRQLIRKVTQLTVKN